MSRETNALTFGRVVFVRREVAQELLLAPGIVNFVLVRLGLGVDADFAAAALGAAAPDLAAITRADLVASDRALFRSLFGTPVNVVAVIGLLVRMLVLGLGLSAAAGPLIVRIAPELGVDLHAGYALRTLGIALALSLVSSLVPVWRIGNLDPKEVFS